MDAYEKSFNKALRFLTSMYYITLSDRFMNQVIGFELVRVLQIDYKIRQVERMVKEYAQAI